MDSPIFSKNPATGNSFSRLSPLCFTAMLCAFAVLLAGPLWDIDLWWHLATGKYIVGNLGLMHQDPFNFINNDSQIHFTLKGYWLAQVLFYFCYSTLGGEYGLIGLRVFTLLLIPLSIFIYCRKYHVPDGISLVTTALCGWLTLYYAGERPQIFSFLFATLILLVFEDIGYGQKVPESRANGYNTRKALLIPGIMLIWANMHPGFLLGSVLIAVFISGETFKFLVLHHPRDKKALLSLIVILSSGILITLVNPNTYEPYIGFLELEKTTSLLAFSEYASPVTYLLNNKLIIYPYWIYLITAIIVIGISLKRIDITHGLFLLLLLILSLKAYRYVPFFVFGTAFYLSRLTAYSVQKNNRFPSLINVIAIVMTLLLIFNSIKGYASTLGQSLSTPINNEKFPVDGAAFISREKPVGKIFNHFNWGGYLIWKLYPDYQVFIDSRLLSLRGYADYTNILWNKRSWKELLNVHQANIIVIPGLQPMSGELYELVNFLYSDKDWHLVYCDEGCLILVRGAENCAIISRHLLDKGRMYDHVIAKARKFIASGITNYNVWMTLSTAYTQKGMYREAASVKITAMTYKPKNSSWMNSFRGGE